MSRMEDEKVIIQEREERYLLTLPPSQSEPHIIGLRVKQKLFELGYSDADFPTSKPDWGDLVRQSSKLTDRSASQLASPLLLLL